LIFESSQNNIAAITNFFQAGLDLAACCIKLIERCDSALSIDFDNEASNSRHQRPLPFSARHFRCWQLGHISIAAESIVYDALYGYCQEMVRRGKPDGQYR